MKKLLLLGLLALFTGRSFAQCDTPYAITEDFSSFSHNQVPPCWTFVNSHIDPYITLKMENTGTVVPYVVLPQTIDAKGTLEFHAVKNGASAVIPLEIGVMNGSTDYASFTSVATVTISGSWQVQSVDLSGYTGSGKHVALRFPNAPYMYAAFQYINYTSLCTGSTSVTAAAKDITLSLGSNGTGSISASDIDNGSVDGCGSTPTLSIDVASFSCDDIGPNTVTLTADDGQGNVDTQTATVTVVSGIVEETLSASSTNLCNSGSVDIMTSGSVYGIEYSLRDNSDDSVIDGPIVGDGNALTFNTGNISSTTTYNVYANTVATQGATVKLNGTSDYVLAETDNRNIDDEVTIAAWVKLNPSTVSHFIAIKYDYTNGYHLVVNAAGNAIMAGRDGDGTYKSSGNSTTLLNDSQWHYLTGVISNGAYKIYVDGVLENSSTNSQGPTLACGANLTFGYFNGNYMNGEVDQIAIWNTTLTDSEIQNNMTTCLVGNESNLVGLYDFDDASGSNCTDKSSSNINATLYSSDEPNAWGSARSTSCYSTSVCTKEMTETITITVGSDVSAPVPDQSTLSTINAECEVTSLTAPTATDNCDGAVTATHNETLPISSSKTVVWTYVDGSGNSTTQNQEVVIADVTAPTPDVANLSNVTGQCEITSLTAPTATDNCDGTITATHNGTLPFTTNQTITWTYVDASGNASSQTQNVVLSDNTAPVPNTASLAEVVGECSVASVTAPTATDNCDGQITATTSTAFPITSTTTIQWEFEDASGNVETQNQLITIEDTEAPNYNELLLDTIFEQCEVASLTAPTATDACEGTITGTHNVSLPISASTTIVWSYVDGSGNTKTQEQVVVIEDTTAPVFIGFTETIESYCAVESLPTLQATDNCVGTITGTHDATFPITASTTVTYTFDDGNGNVSTREQDVVINAIDVSVSVVENEITSMGTFSDGYQWLDCDNNYSEIDGAIYTSFTATQSGNYAVEITLDGCADTSECVAITMIGVEDYNRDVLNIQPNPAVNQIQLTGMGQSSDYQIMDMTGKLIIKGTGNSVQVSELANGTYIVQVIADNKLYMSKFVKVN